MNYFISWPWDKVLVDCKLLGILRAESSCWTICEISFNIFNNYLLLPWKSLSGVIIHYLSSMGGPRVNADYIRSCKLNRFWAIWSLIRFDLIDFRLPLTLHGFSSLHLEIRIKKVNIDKIVHFWWSIWLQSDNFRFILRFFDHLL